MSLTYKLFISVLISVIISFILFASVVIKIEKDKVNEVFYSKIEHNKEIYSTSISTLLYTLNEDVIKSIINSIYKDNEIMKLELIDNSNFINIKIDSNNYKNENLVKSVISLKYNDEDLGKLIIYYSKYLIIEHLEKYKLIIFSFALLLTLLLSLIVYFFINKVSSSLKLLTNASIKISQGDLSQELTIDRKDEIGMLSEQFEFMRKALIQRRDINKKQLIEIKEKDSILIQQTKMAAMGEMLENISHQWRQPLSVISTAATGAKLQKEMDTLSDSQLIFILTSINNSAQYLSQTIEDFSAFFDPRNNKEKSFLISDTIKKTLSIVNLQFTSKNINIIENIEDCTILAIENELIQVFVNILNNARDALLKFVDKQRFIFIDTYIKNNYLYIDIKDNAKGIDEKIIDKIFEPYFTTKHQSQGTGVGLYMCDNIVRTHLKGNIIVKNESFKYKDILYTGTKFTISIRIKKEI
ncbi:sensor histidine kinase [Poseidonibacter antarcticus]|uniref:sensor histidine kinase n=1 Tax=Poseidonibacter antarcticus TaxID=2478538 RepID=UPI000EF4C2FD|nr:HAMP domain-containing sensor histidine kinase [Poseidonibacter antarcticus]